MEETDDLLARIEYLLDLNGLSTTKFGYTVCGDPALVPKMRKGRRIKQPKLRMKIEAALDKLEKEGTL